MTSKTTTKFSPEVRARAVRMVLDDGKPPLKGEMWFAVTDQPTFPVAGFWQHTKEGAGFTMVTCDPNELVAPIHPKAMITIWHPSHDRWLQGSYDDIVAPQRPYPATAMTGWGPMFPTRRKDDARERAVLCPLPRCWWSG